MLKFKKQFFILEEEGAIVNANDISYVRVKYDNTTKKYNLIISFIQSEKSFAIGYETLIEAERKLNEIFTVMGLL